MARPSVARPSVARPSVARPSRSSPPAVVPPAVTPPVTVRTVTGSSWRRTMTTSLDRWLPRPGCGRAGTGAGGSRLRTHVRSPATFACPSHLRSTPVPAHYADAMTLEPGDPVPLRDLSGHPGVQAVLESLALHHIAPEVRHLPDAVRTARAAAEALDVSPAEIANSLV